MNYNYLKRLHCFHRRRHPPKGFLQREGAGNGEGSCGTVARREDRSSEKISPEIST